MQENFELVQRGFRILVASMSGYVGQELNKAYQGRWWEGVLDTLSDQRDLPERGTYGELVDSLDIANCIRLLDRKWNDVFRFLLPLNCRTWAKELMGVRNIVAHLGQQDLEQPMAERALDTMALLCKEMDPEGAAEIREIYWTVREKANGGRGPGEALSGGGQSPAGQPMGALSPGHSASSGGSAFTASASGGEKNLLSLVGTDVVQKTTLTRKVTYAGKTVVYPVYRVRLDALYYNDQNDRIATWISRYEAENGADSLSGLDVDIYNMIIENFICESNPEAIQRTQKNIALGGQRESGVTLADGRIVDGNRRFTCLRRIQRGSSTPQYFETVIMDMDIREDKKQIKLLELSIQHGEEKKVDYDLIDYAIGTYRDVVQTGLLTESEYAASTNEPLTEVRRRVEIAGIICEFLEYLRIPGQYYAAREYQVYSLFQEMLPVLKKLDTKEQTQLKRIIFNNVMMRALADQRKFIRDIKVLVKNAVYQGFFEEQEKWGQVISERFAAVEVRAKEDVDRFAEANSDIAEELKLSMERALLRSRAQVLKNRPGENVSKCITLLTEVDSRLFGRMDEEEKENLKAELDELARITARFQRMLAR